MPELYFHEYPTQHEVVQGEAITLLIDVDELADGVADGALIFYYDASVFTVSDDDLAAGSMLDGSDVTLGLSNTQNPGFIKLNLQGTNGLPGPCEGGLARVTLHTKPDAPVGETIVHVAKQLFNDPQWVTAVDSVNLEPYTFTEENNGDLAFASINVTEKTPEPPPPPPGQLLYFGAITQVGDILKVPVCCGDFSPQGGLVGFMLALNYDKNVMSLTEDGVLLGNGLPHGWDGIANVAQYKGQSALVGYTFTPLVQDSGEIALFEFVVTDRTAGSTELRLMPDGPDSLTLTRLDGLRGRFDIPGLPMTVTAPIV